MKTRSLAALAAALMVAWAVPAAATQIPDDVNFRWSVPGLDLPNFPEGPQPTSGDHPVWITDGTGSNTRLWVPNDPRPDLIKTVYLELTFRDLEARGLALTIPDFDPAEVPAGYESTAGTPTIDPDDPLIVTWTWTIEPQPPYEILELKNSTWDLRTIGGENPVSRIEVASGCIPEPASLGVLLLGGALGLTRRRA